MVKNVRTEFISHIGKITSKVKCAMFGFSEPDEYGCAGDTVSYWKISEGYSDDDFNNFLSMIDVEYDSGFGLQELYGFIWYEDGTWSERGEYDGSEWWEHKSPPVIPEDLK